MEEFRREWKPDIESSYAGEEASTEASTEVEVEFGLESFCSWPSFS